MMKIGIVSVMSVIMSIVWLNSLFLCSVEMVLMMIVSMNLILIVIIVRWFVMGSVFVSIVDIG